MFRILLVDDYKEWRRQVALLLPLLPEAKVIYEASDGSEAVQRAQELKPHLVLLDIGLPKLNGIEAARQIQLVSPNSKILFLSQNNSVDAVQAALSTGAEGYVYKADAGRELLAAVEAVLHGERFISSSLKNEFSAEARDPRRHVILFCSDDAYLLNSFTRVVADALNAGNAAIVFATELHRESLLQRLAKQGVDVGRAIQDGTYISVDVAESVSAMIVDDLPDPIRFFSGIIGLIETASMAVKSEQPRVVVCSEGVAFLQAEGKADAATRLEQLCNELANTHEEVDVLCAYPC